ncbi:hypothetical protein [Micromonospora sp. NPDC000668]|uniref:hypothetical protein n=1 Tax=Micromonospora sp. NPDC000668 TaxID=3364219 RepID=UPI0036D04B62
MLAAAFPGADVLAVEPSPVLRAALLARMVDNVELRAPVTVEAADALRIELPDRLSAALAMNRTPHPVRAAGDPATHRRPIGARRR